MEKRTINPWKWQDERGYVQAVEVIQPTATLYCAGQAAVHPDGRSSAGDMKTQLLLAIDNLEAVIRQAGYKCENLVRLNIFTTSSEELLPHFFEVYNAWVRKHGIQTALTFFEVKSLFETLKVELQATVVR